MKFSEGDTVSRKAGGPLMTVEENRTDHFVSVAWFDLEGVLHRDCFHPVVLQKWKIVEESEETPADPQPSYDSKYLHG